MMTLFDNILENVILIVLKACLDRMSYRHRDVRMLSLVPNFYCKDRLAKLLYQQVRRIIRLAFSAGSDADTGKTSDLGKENKSECCTHDNAIHNIENEMKFLRSQLAELLNNRRQQSHGILSVKKRPATTSPQPSPARCSLMKRTMAEIRARKPSLKPVDRPSSNRIFNGVQQCEKSCEYDAQDLLHKALRERFASWSQCSIDSDDDDAGDTFSPTVF